MPLRTRNAPCRLLCAALVALAWPQLGTFAQELPTAVDAANDVTSAGFCTLDVALSQESVFVHQSVSVRVQIELDRAFSNEQLVQLFRRELDLPVQLRAPWIEGNDGLEWVPSNDANLGGDVRIAVGANVVALNETSNVDAERRVLEFRRTFRVEAPGVYPLEPAELRFSYATEFEDDPFRGRLPVESLDAFVASRPVTLTVLALPELGRPPEFSGAVGNFGITATADPRDLDVGDSLRWTLHIDGDGWLADIEAPRIDALDGFRVLGWVEEPMSTGRAFAYDLVPTSHRTSRIPAFTYTYFDPAAPAGYRTAETAPITILVRPAMSLEAPAGAPPALEGDPEELRILTPFDVALPEGETYPYALWLAGGVLLVAWVVVHSRRDND